MVLVDKMEIVRDSDPVSRFNWLYFVVYVAEEGDKGEARCGQRGEEMSRGFKGVLAVIVPEDERTALVRSR